MSRWTLECSECGLGDASVGPPSVCSRCGLPLLVRYAALPRPGSGLSARWDMWRYGEFLPLRPEEVPVCLGEGLTPILELPHLARALGVRRLLVKDESGNPTGSFKARGMSAAVTRAREFGVPGLVVPTAGNAGAALAAYGSAARLPVRVFAPESTPAALLATVRALGAELVTVPGHIGDAGKHARAFAADSGYVDVSTLREPYRIEGKKTMGLEIAEQLDWRLPDVIVYPTGGGTGLIAMWKAFRELRDAGWLDPRRPLPRMISAQATGCAPIVRAFAHGRDHAAPWDDPQTHASGLRVPAPLGDRLMLRVLRESAGDAEAVAEEEIREATTALSRASGIDAAPEGGCALAACARLVAQGRISSEAEALLLNTGSGASYRA